MESIEENNDLATKLAQMENSLDTDLTNFKNFGDALSLNQTLQSYCNGRESAPGFSPSKVSHVSKLSKQHSFAATTLPIFNQNSHKSSFSPHFMLILKQLAICSSTYFISKSKKLLAKGFTHVVTLTNIIPKPLLLQFENLQIKL
jgi:hypothetical protein